MFYRICNKCSAIPYEPMALQGGSCSNRVWQPTPNISCTIILVPARPKCEYMSGVDMYIVFKISGRFFI